VIDKLHIVYRISELTAAGAKNKLENASKIQCLVNTVQTFNSVDITVLADMVSEKFLSEIQSVCPNVTRISCGSGGASFRYAAKYAMSFNSEDVIYLLEDDYLHLPNSVNMLLDGFRVGADYVTLYDHPDKYVDSKSGGNPLVRDGGELTRIKLGQLSHWKITNSTTMTFATRVETLKSDWSVFLRYCGGNYTDDYRLFRHLAKWKRRVLVSSVPGFSTHCEVAFLSPLRDWVKDASNPELSVVK
jgi:hypothetical protein